MEDAARGFASGDEQGENHQTELPDIGQMLQEIDRILAEFKKIHGLPLGGSKQ